MSAARMRFGQAQIPPAAEGRASAWIWTEFWQAGRGNCCDDAPEGARDLISTLWARHFEALPIGARILDLATGGGAVADLALRVGERTGRRFEVVGVDLAAAGLSAGTQHPEQLLRFAGGVDLARLPFPGDLFDSAVSQFGVEYADMGSSLPEIARVLKEGASCFFIMHHADSVFCRTTRARLDLHAKVTEGYESFALAEAVFRTLAARRPVPEYQAAAAQFRASVERMRAVFEACNSDDPNLAEIVSFVSELAAEPRAFDPLGAIDKLTKARHSILAWQLRLEAQLSAARDTIGMENIVQSVHAAGLVPVELAETSDPQGRLLAWTLRMRKLSSATGNDSHHGEQNAQAHRQ